MTVTHHGTARDHRPSARTATVEFVVPVYNEEVDLAESVRRLDDALAASFPYDYRITVADNASTDATWAVARDLAQERPTVQAVHLDLKGRGRALKQVWLASEADVVAYMDVDLSTDLKAVLPLVAPLVSGHSDVAIGSRLARGSRVERGPKREFISRTYNLILRGTLRVSFSDAQCGFKAIRTDVARELLPLVEDDNWFFDTEVLVLAQRAGLRIHEVPVDWVDDPGSTVDIVATATEDLRGIWRLFTGLTSGRVPLDRVRASLRRSAPAPATPVGLLSQLIRFGVVGVASTVAYFVLYLLLRDVVGAQAANLVALLVTAVANTAANRRLTFGIRGSEGALAHQLGGLLAFAAALGLTSGSLWALHSLAPAAGRGAEVFVLIVANATATLLRFAALRFMMHKPRQEPDDA
ncbi:bifunctional glycosyltransferase family 2/GtrA family protein [Propionicicella superfundia]|uniref:bifunctional glycosyltransferase family 2/GtrA family protein n=1 Tax=Propionicicella superfundia TaxID=348582 RepID=UPI00041235C6|nr:bifunctional glycosyltransferase family 2/GtrA family protein [Propionicicella superfundia]